MREERAGPRNSLRELMSYLEDRLEHDTEEDDTEFLELYQELKKHGNNVLKDEHYRDILQKLDDEVTELYG